MVKNLERQNLEVRRTAIDNSCLPVQWRDFYQREVRSKFKGELGYLATVAAIGVGLAAGIFSGSSTLRVGSMTVLGIGTLALLAAGCVLHAAFPGFTEEAKWLGAFRVVLYPAYFQLVDVCRLVGRHFAFPRQFESIQTRLDYSYS
jgi:hypothetical protein